MLIRRSVRAGCETGAGYFHRFGLEKIVPSVDARSRNGIFVFFVSGRSVSLSSSASCSFHVCPMRNDRRFSMRTLLSNSEQIVSGLKIRSWPDWTSLVERFSFGNLAKTRQNRHTSRNTLHTCRVKRISNAILATSCRRRSIQQTYLFDTFAYRDLVEAGARNLSKSALSLLDWHHTIAVLIDFIRHQYYRNIEISVLQIGTTISVKIITTRIHIWNVTL